LINQESHFPLIKIAVQAEVKTKERTYNLGVLSTDSNGYVSFKNEILSNENITQVILKPFTLVKESIDILPFLKENNTDTFYWYVNKDLISRFQKKDFPSVQKPDIDDLMLSPNLVTRSFKKISSGGDCGCSDKSLANDSEINDVAHQLEFDSTTYDAEKKCGILVPDLKGEECVNIYTIETIPNAETATIFPNPANTESGKDKFPIKVTKAELNKFRVCTELLGYALGDLVHSIPLAPCESVKVVVTNNSIKLLNSKQEGTSLSDFISNESVFNRSLSERIKASVTQNSFGLAASGTIPINKKINLNLALGYQFNNRTVKSDVLQNLHDQFSQQANSQRLFKSAIVQEASQTTQVNVQTRSLRNNNHCHTLTFMYFDINEHVKVTSKHISTKNAILIKYPVQTFDKNLIKCKQHILKPALLDDSLLKCFDKNCCNGEEIKDEEDIRGEVCTKTNRVTVKFKVSSKASSQSLLKATSKVRLRNGSVLSAQVPKATTYYQQGKEYSVDFTLQNNCITDIKSFEIELANTPITGGNLKLQTIELNVWNLTDGIEENLYRFNDNNSPKTINRGSTLNLGDVSYHDKLLDNDEIQDVFEADDELSCSCCEQQLVNHMNCNKLYYNKILWLNEDEDQRWINLDKYLYNGKPLTQSIINIPLAVQGDWVAFELADEAWNPVVNGEFLSELYYAPTGALFSESVLGECGSCEPVNSNVYWDWSESPCNCDAPNISDAMINQSLTNLGFTSQALTSLIQMNSSPNIAPSVLLAALVSGAMTDPKFADMLKDLISKLPGSTTNKDTTKDSGK
jgi:hypothetical protein